MGEQALALAEGLAAGPAPTSGGKRIFMDVSGRMLIALPLVAGVVLLAGLLIAFGWLAWRRGGIVRGAAFFVGTAVLSALITWLMVTLIGFARPGMFWRAFPVWTHLATYASVIAAGTMLIATLGRSASVRQLRVGHWLMFLLLGAAIGAVAPGGIVYFLFPPLILLIGIAAGRFWPKAEAVAAIVAIAFLYFTWGELLALLEELINQGPMWLFAPLGALILLPALIEAKALVELGPAAPGGAGGRSAERCSMGCRGCRAGLFRRPPAALRDRAHHRHHRQQGLLGGS